MKSVLFPKILVAALLSLGMASAQTKTSSHDSATGDKTSSVSAKEAISDKTLKDKPLKMQETASAKDGMANPGAGAVKAEKSLEADTSAPEAREYYESGIALLESGKFDEAVVKFKQAVKREPGNPQAQYSLAVAYSKSNKYSEAAESFKRAVRLKPDWAEAHFGLGCMYYVLDKSNQALEEYKKLQSLNSPRADTLWRIISEGMASLASGKGQPSSPKQDETKGNESIVRAPAKKEGSGQIDSSLATSNHGGAPAERQSQTLLSTAGVAANGNSKSSLTSSPSTSVPTPLATPIPTPIPTPVATPIPTPIATPIPSPVSTPIPSVTKADRSNSETPVAEETTLTQTYRVGIGDVIDIRLSVNPSTNRSTLYTVIDQGMIEFPLVGGTLSVVGLTVDEIRARLGAELKRREIHGDTPLSVLVRQYASHPVIVGGLVAFPGTKNLKREAVPLYVLLAEAQPRPDAARAIIAREGSPTLTVDLGDQPGLNVLVRPGDLINISARPQEFYYIAGRVNYPGQKAFQPGITLLQAILAAGGFTKPSDGTAEISREGAAGRLTTTKYRLKEIKAGKIEDPRLQPGDRIEVAH